MSARRGRRDRRQRPAARREEQAARQAPDAESVIPAGELAAARAIARRLGMPVYAIRPNDADGSDPRVSNEVAHARRLALTPPLRGRDLCYVVSPNGAVVLGAGWE